MTPVGEEAGKGQEVCRPGEDGSRLPPRVATGDAKGEAEGGRIGVHFAVA